MSETRTIKDAIAEFAQVADAYEQAKAKLAAALASSGPTGGGGWTNTHSSRFDGDVGRTSFGRPSPLPEPARPTPRATKTKAKRALVEQGGDTLTARSAAVLADGKEWRVRDVAARLSADPKAVAEALSLLARAGRAERIGWGRYAKGAKTSKAENPADTRVPTVDKGGLTPLERAAVIERRTTGTGTRSGLEPTAEGRVLAALGSGPKTFGVLPALCSLSTQGCSDALASLTAAGKVTSYNGAWKLKEAS